MNPALNSVFTFPLKNQATTSGPPIFQYIKPGDARIVFQGIDQAEFFEFIYAIRNKAMQQGKQRDDEWLADYAATCFFGEALRWHLGLPEDVQCSWKLLLKALIEKYSVSEQALVPTPAAAAVPQASPPPARTSSIFSDIQGSRNSQGISRAPLRGKAVKVNIPRSDVPSEKPQDTGSITWF